MIHGLSFLQKASQQSSRWILKGHFSSSFKLESFRRGFLSFIFFQKKRKSSTSLKNSIFIHLFMASHKKSKTKNTFVFCQNSCFVLPSHVWRVIKSSVPGGGPKGEKQMHDGEGCHSAGRRCSASALLHGSTRHCFGMCVLYDAFWNLFCSLFRVSRNSLTHTLRVRKHLSGELR